MWCNTLRGIGSSNSRAEHPWFAVITKEFNRRSTAPMQTTAEDAVEQGVRWRNRRPAAAESTTFCHVRRLTVPG